jgi:hypothetical protein
VKAKRKANQISGGFPGENISVLVICFLFRESFAIFILCIRPLYHPRRIHVHVLIVIVLGITSSLVRNALRAI